jgi:predicted nucleic-acid-binding Zn-ribbon protein
LWLHRIFLGKGEEGIAMSEVKKCPKCSGEMVKGSKENLERNFACTRGEPKPEVPQNVKVQSYYCKSCGYVEFYRELTVEERQTPSLIEDAEKALKLHRREKKE